MSIYAQEMPGRRNFDRFITSPSLSPSSPKNGTEETAGGQKRCQRVPSRTVNRIPSSYSKTKAAIPRVASKPKVAFLEVPPINTEPDCMHLTYNQMEIVGKRYKETRRRLKVLCFFSLIFIVHFNGWQMGCGIKQAGDLSVCLPDLFIM